MKTPVSVWLWYSDAWHDITAAERVYTRDPISIRREARPELGQRPAPTTIDLSIDNRSGDYSWRVPTAALYGLIGRNTPIRVILSGYDVTADTFNRVVAEGWGTSEYDATAWTSTGAGGTVGATDSHIDAPLTATHSVPATSAFRFSYLAATTLPADVTATVRLRALDTAGGHDILGGDIEGGLMLRLQDINTYYHARVEFNADQSVTASLHSIGGTGSIGSATVSGLTYAGQWLVCKMQCVGSTIRMRVWEYGGTEPVTWDVSVTNTEISAAGRVGVRSGVASGNTNTGRHVHYQDLTLDHAPRATGEVESWPLRWTVEGNDVWSPIKAFGILRRLNAPGVVRPAHSPLRRAVAISALTGLVFYWPMEDPNGATSAAALVGPTSLTPGTNAPSFGRTSDLPGGSVGCVDFTDGRTLTAQLSDISATAWAFSWASDAEDKDDQSDDASWMRIDLDAGGSYVAFAPHPQGPAFGAGVNAEAVGGALSGPVSAARVDDLVGWHWYTFTAEQNGANIDLELFRDGVSIDTGSVAGTLTAPVRVTLNQGVIGTFDLPGGICHLLVHDGALNTDLTDALVAHVGESAAERIRRLCEEDGVALVVYGDPDLSALVGAQRAAPWLDLLHDPADADGGLLHEPRGFLGLAYRTHHSLYNQTATVSLDYAAGGEVAPPLAPVPDTAHVVNDVTVTRHLGASARAEKLTGTLNVNEPADDPDGAGRVPKEHTLVLYTDAQARPHAEWLRHLGTWDEDRYPVIMMDATAMDADAKTALISRAASLDLGGRLAITSTPALLPPEDIEVHAVGLLETLASHRYTIGVSAVPARPYDVAVADSSLADTAGSTTTEALDTTETDVDVTSPGALWSATASDYDIIIGGEVMTVTAVSGAGPGQTLTVTRSVNGVVKSHASGAVVKLSQPARVAR